jgi:Rrf2 family protein
MLCLSQTTGYAIKALGCLTNPGARSCFIADVARTTRVPRPYLAKIINLLARQGLVISKRGYRGGIALARPPAGISLLEVVEAVEGKDWLGPCLLAIEECAQGHDCPTHAFWKEIREQIRAKLHTTTLAEVIAASPIKIRSRNGRPAASRGVRKPGESRPGRGGSSRRVRRAAPKP